MSFGARNTPVTRQFPPRPSAEVRKAIEELASWIDEDPDKVQKSLGYDVIPKPPGPILTLQTGGLKNPYGRQS